MERIGPRNIDRSVGRACVTRRLQAGCLLLAGVLALGGCVIVPVHHAYVPPGPVYAPAPVVVAPAPVYYGGGGPRYHYRHGHW